MPRARIDAAHLSLVPTQHNPDETPRLRVLLIVEAANPEWTSVPLVGWNLASALRREASALIVTQVRNREAFLRSGLVEGSDFIAIDNEIVARRLYKLSNILRGGDNKGWTMVTALSSLSYYSFEAAVWKRMRARILAGEFDIVHRITPLSPTSQSLLASRLKAHNVPFILGPLNGGLPWPKGFEGVRRKEKEWLAPIRNIYRYMPAYASTRANAAAIIVGSQHTLSELPASSRNRTFLIPENGVDPDMFSPRPVRGTGPVVRIAFVGRLVPYKGADILIESASSLCKSGKAEILIVGDGPQRSELEAMVAKQRLSGSIKFAGWIKHDLLADMLKNYDILALPSIREFGGGVVLEAMSLGLVPVVADYGGPAELVDASTGMSVPFTNRASLIDGFAEALRLLVEDPERINSMSRAAVEKVRREYTWSAKARQIIDIYRWARS